MNGALMLCAAIVVGIGSADAYAETYVILSLVGDHLTVVGMGAQLGSHIDQNRHQTLAVTGSGFDDFADRVADAIIAKARPSATVVTLRAKDPNLYQVRDSWLDSDTPEMKNVMAFLPQGMPRTSDDWLLVIAPYRDELELRTRFDTRGAGKVAGLGFYVDTITRMTRSETSHENVQGFLAVFAHFQMMLVNLQSAATVAHERVVLGTTFAAVRAEDRTAWNALTETEKVKALQSLMKRGIEKSLPGMLSSSKP